MIRRFVGGILKREGYRVLEADVGEAVRSLREDPAAVTLLVTNVPGQFVEFGDRVRIIYVATSPDPALAARFRCCRILRKPFAPADLAACADELARAECH